MSELRFVFDTNAVVSALLLKQSVSRQAFDEARRHGKVLLSLETLNELNDVLRREKFNRYLSERERLLFLSAFVQEAVLVEVYEVVQESRDPKDDKFLALAVIGRADFIVSGDKDLLTFDSFRGIPVVTPRQLLNHFQEV